LVLATIAQRFRVEFPAGHIVRPFPSFTLRPKTSPWVKLEMHCPAAE
jgi:hypothetical protein